LRDGEEKGWPFRLAHSSATLSKIIILLLSGNNLTFAHRFKDRTAKFAEMGERTKLQVAMAIAPVFFRFSQLFSTIIAGYGVCYLIWMHDNHPCKYNGYCSPMTNSAAVPIGEVVMVVAVSRLILGQVTFSVGSHNS
jgi:hypothetical protein